MTPSPRPLPKAREHDEFSRECWCNPVCVHVTEEGVEVWSHRDGDETAPAQVIAEAIVEAVFGEDGA